MANRFLVAGGTGNWDSTTNWAATSGAASGASFPIAGDVVAFDSLSGNAPMTVNTPSACASLIVSGTYSGALTFNSTLTLTSTVTFVSGMTIAGTAGTLILTTGGQTITSGGKTLTCALTIPTNAFFTLGDNWAVNGLVTINASTGTTTIDGVGKTLTCNGGFRQGGSSSASVVTGTTKFILAGGTWDTSAGGAVNNDLDLAGNVTLSGSLKWGTSGKTLRRVSGTITTAGSTLTFLASTTIDTAGMTWDSVVFTASVSVTLSSDLAWSGTMTFNNSVGITIGGTATLNGTGAVTFAGSATVTLNKSLTTTGTLTLPNAAVTFAGSAGFTVGTLTTAALSASRIHTLTFGNTYTVTTSLVSLATSAFRQALKSSSPGNKVVFTLNPAATQQLVYCDPTDVDSSGGQTVVSIGGTITTSTNWVGSVPAGGGSPAAAVTAYAFL